jgi:nicotinate-nucleotide adenylyltransferase
MRIGLYGGTFNPIHIGHLRAAEEVREAMHLDLVYFIPAGMPPHKPGGRLAPAEMRLEMVRLAIKNNLHFMISDFETKRVKRSYTIDTVRFFLSSLRQRQDWFLMMGVDAFCELDTWKAADELTSLCNLIVHTRHRKEESELSQGVLANVTRFRYREVNDHYVNMNGRELYFVKTTYFPVSATAIRRIVQQGKSIRYLVPPEVAEYIAHHRLYRTE